ncbi:MAG: transposase [Proteobacteria bacterium]|nr:transposase [Pseudomonadota bacterium]
MAYRQWTVSLPWRIHWQVGTNTKLLSAALSVVLRSLFAWQRRVARRVGIAQPLCGSVTFIHRFNSQLLLSPHFHALVPDGVFSVDEGGALGFAQLPPPRDDEVEALLRRIGDRIEALVQQQCADAIDDDDPDALQHSRRPPSRLVAIHGRPTRHPSRRPGLAALRSTATRCTPTLQWPPRIGVACVGCSATVRDRRWLPAVSRC